MSLERLAVEQLEGGSVRITAVEPGGIDSNLLYTPRCD
jgi:hypothetical protein